MTDESYGPLAVLASAAISYLCVLAAGFLRERTHASRVARIADALGRIAGAISDELRALPPGADLDAVKTAALARGVAEVKQRLPDVIGVVGVEDTVLGGMLSGELGKLRAGAAMPASAVAVGG